MAASSRRWGVLLILALLGVWEAVAQWRLVPAAYFPPVSLIAEQLWRLLVSGALPAAYLHTFRRVAQGYGLAVAIGITTGLAMGYVRFIHETVAPLIELVRPLPSAAVIPVAMLFLGIGDEMKVFTIAWACFFPILLNAIHGVRDVERGLIDTGRTFGLRRLLIIAKIILPASAPHLATGMRQSLAIGLILGVTTELIAGQNGIGYFILNAQRTFQATDLYAGVYTLAAVGYVLNRLFLLLEARLLFWHRQTSLAGWG